MHLLRSLFSSSLGSYAPVNSTSNHAASPENITQGANMWPVRTRRGTRKRCAALFVVGVCAAVMVLTRPFVTAPDSSALEDSPPPLPQAVVNSSVAFPETPQPPAGQTLNVSLLLAPPLAPLPNLTSANASSNEPQAEPSSTSEKATSEANKMTDAKEEERDGAAKTSSPNVPSSTSEKVPGTAAPPTTTAGAGNASDTPTVYVITPTFPRMEQMPELTRLGQTLMLVSHLHWIVAEDAPKKSPEVEALLRHTELPYAYILGAMPDSYRKKKGSKPKGVANRLAGLQWIREHAQDNGVMFFADDDNSYDIRLFEEMRYTKKVSMWPVGLVTQLGISTPVVKDGKVVDFYDGWIASRVFPVDMAGFAVNVGFLKSRPNATMPFKAGFEEDGFLKSLNITKADIEPKADNCTKIYVWHTKTVSNKAPQKMTDKDKNKFNNTNLFALPNIV